MEHKTREVLGCDYFLDALGDPELALKIREKYPPDLDSALRTALQLQSGLKVANDTVNPSRESCEN